MDLASLSARLVGTTGVCLVAVMAPISGPDRTAALAAFALGVALASVLPGYDRWAAWIVGPAVLVLALAPPSGLWSLVALVALALVGFACFTSAGMERAVPALGLPLLTYAFRNGSTISGPLLGAWATSVVAMVVLVNRASPLEGGAPLGPDPAVDVGPGRALVFGRRRSLQAVAVAATMVPAALVGAQLLAGHGPQGDQATLLGRVDGAALRGHPGLTGGLDAGLPVSLGDDVVLRVRASQPHYWRGTTYDEWDGRRWTSRVAVRPVIWSSERLDLSPEPPESGAGLDGSATAPVRPVPETQTFTVVPSGLDVVLGAWRMTSVQTTARSALLGDDGSLTLTTPLKAGATWTVTSEVASATPDELRRADPSGLPASSWLLDRYAREDDVTPPVAGLARQITAGAPTTYDKIDALEKWVGANITYSRDIEPLAEGADAVQELLFGTRQGYCEQIGSALVVMLRSLGIPARLAVGYVPGRFDATTGEWVSLASDAHAWAEVYFPGVGWQGFDPTAGVAPGFDGGNSRAIGWPRASALYALSVAGVLWGALAALRWQGQRRGPPTGRAGAPAGLVELQARFDRCGPALGRSWPPSMTLREKGADLAGAGVEAAVADAAVRELERTAFGPAPVDPAPEAVADAGWRQLDGLERAVADVAASHPAARPQPAGTRVWDRSR